jgi:hypothetical protein
MTDSSLEYWSVSSESDTLNNTYSGSVKLKDLYVNYDASNNVENYREHNIFDGALQT